MVSCARKAEQASSPSPANKNASSAEVLVSVAASTEEIVEQLAAAFAQRTGATIKVNPGSSSRLANQILEGAPADLFLSANREWAAEVMEADLALGSVELLTNQLVIVVPKGNPAGIQEPQDLLAERVKRIALAGEQAPAGKYADQALAKLDLLDKLTAARKIARGQDLRGALSFVERGEAEAGIVYATDVAASDVEVAYEFDPALHDEIGYVLVLLKQGENPAAKAFFEYLQSDAAADGY
jgi:molybdate transport system substrate-binding protein